MKKNIRSTETVSASCVGCKFLYARDEGYSNWTVTDSTIHCAVGKNPNLPAEEPYDWNNDATKGDNWKATQASRCERYAAGAFVRLDVDGEYGPADGTNDAEAIEAICKDSGREAKGS